MEAALGMSFVGKRALVCMKHVGMNVAADCFVNSAITGVKGGLIVIAADDPPACTLHRMNRTAASTEILLPDTDVRQQSAGKRMTWYTTDSNSLKNRRTDLNAYGHPPRTLPFRSRAQRAEATEQHFIQ